MKKFIYALPAVSPFIFLLFVLVISGCKKYNKDYGYPVKEKKWVVSTIAGEGKGGFADGPALSAKFNAPVDVAVAADGTIYVADFKNHRVWEIKGGMVSTFAGNDQLGFVNDNGVSAQFENPFLISLDAAGNVYVLDEEDSHISKISPAADVTPYAGTDINGFLNGEASVARFQWNEGGIVADAQGNVYIEDTFNQRIRKISTAGQVTTVAGIGIPGFRDGDTAIAQLKYPNGIAADKEGILQVADAGNFCIRKITTGGIVSTLAGNGTNGNADGDAGVAQFNSLADIVEDNQGNLYVSDDNRIRRVSPQGVVTTIAGTTPGYGYVDGAGAASRFAGLAGLGIDGQGNIYVTDINYNRIRKSSFE